MLLCLHKYVLLPHTKSIFPILYNKSLLKKFVLYPSFLQMLADKEALTAETSELTSTVRVLQDSFLLLRQELTECRNTSQGLEHKLQVLMEKAQRREHMLPRTLKSMYVVAAYDSLEYW